MEEVVKLLRLEVSKVKPYVTLGDDDSIYLTEYQEGLIAGLVKAISLIERKDK